MASNVQMRCFWLVVNTIDLLGVGEVINEIISKAVITIMTYAFIQANVGFKTLSKGHFSLKGKLGSNANQSDKIKEAGQRIGTRKGVCKRKK